MADIFISYSRIDKPFVQKLHGVLTQQKKEIWVDWEDIPEASNWRAEIQEGIEKSDAIIFVLSPDFLTSMECMMELEISEEFNKRLIPIVYRDPDTNRVPPSLASLNWIFFREEDDFDAAVSQLLVSTEVDLNWVKTHTRLTSRAVEWEANERNTSYLLRGDDLAEAVQYLSQPGREPALTYIQQEYIVASQQKQAADLNRELSQARRLRQRLWIAVSLLAAVLVVGIFAIFMAIQNGTLILGTDEIVDTMVLFADGQTNSDLCWAGSLRGLEQQIMPACNRAVELDPAFYRPYESRGLAFALLNNYSAAAEDFTTAVNLSREFNDDQDRIPRWENWIRSLEQGQNPFSDDIKQKLLEEWEQEKLGKSFDEN